MTEQRYRAVLEVGAGVPVTEVAERFGVSRQAVHRWKPMELWQLDIVGGIRLANGGEAKVVTGVDDDSRFCVIATVVRRATGRAVCLAFAQALQRFGIPDEVLTDNGKQFTGRFNQPRPAEVLFERICRENGIVARNTKPRSPTTTGKVERFHQTLQRELLDDVDVWPDLETAQAAVDAFRVEYNTKRPHQALDMAFPADRFTARPADGRLPLRLPATLTPPVPGTGFDAADRSADRASIAGPCGDVGNGGEPVNLAVEVTRVAPGSGNLTVCGQQFWLGPDRAGQPITLWADTTVVHLLVNGVRHRTVPSRLTVAHLRQLLADGGRPAGHHPSPPATFSPAQRSRSTGSSAPTASSPPRLPPSRRHPLRRPPAHHPPRPRPAPTRRPRCPAAQPAQPAHPDRTGPRPRRPPRRPATSTSPDALARRKARLLPRRAHGGQAARPCRARPRRPHPDRRSRRHHLARLRR
jgi:transposase InsO family protein